MAASLLSAVRKGDVSSCQTLLKKVDVNAVDGENRSALFYAANNGFLDCAELLVKSGADLNARDKDGATALQKAVLSHHPRMVEYLLGRGADPNIGDKSDNTCMHFCAFTGNIDIAELLLKAGGHLDEPDHERRSPLHWAAWKKHLEFCRWLLSAGAKIDCPDEHGKTPLFYSVISQEISLVICLAEFGADAAHRDLQGRTAVDIAQAKGFEQAVQYLTQLGGRGTRGKASSSSSAASRRASLRVSGQTPQKAALVKAKRSVRAEGTKENASCSQLGESLTGEGGAMERQITSVLIEEMQRTQRELEDARMMTADKILAEKDPIKQIALLTEMLQSEQKRTKRYSTLILRMSSRKGAEGANGVGEKTGLVRRTVEVQAQEDENRLLKAKEGKMVEEIRRLTDIVEDHQSLLQSRELENKELKRQLGEFFRRPTQLRENLTMREDSRVRMGLLRQESGRLRTDLRQLKGTVAAWREQAAAQVDEARQMILQMYERKNGKGMLAMKLYKKVLEERKQLWNQLQDLKGAIRVYCRIRPCASSEAMAVAPSTQEGHVSLLHASKKRRFEFDRVFGPRSTQEEVFEDTKPLVRSVIDGYNVCIFAYGQTGSGKTYTMQGPPSNPGVNSRALCELFELTRQREPEGFSYCIGVSVVEIYNEKIFCLLDSHREPLEAKQSPDGMELTGAKRLSVTHPEDVRGILDLAAKHRSTAATNLNEHSSRSHLLLLIRVEGFNKVTGERSVGKLTLVDLAGSERLDRSGTSGAAAKETVAINSSLSALGNVISALQKNDPAAHVPYRNSKLTYLLQDSLGAGNSKTLMFMQVDSRATNSGESLQSLQFAERVKTVQVPTPASSRRAPPTAAGSSRS